MKQNQKIAKIIGIIILIPMMILLIWFLEEAASLKFVYRTNLQVAGLLLEGNLELVEII